MTQDEINANVKTFIEACERGDIDFVHAALKRDESLVNVKSDKYNNTPLMCAAREGQKNIVKLLIDNGADPNIKDCIGATALHFALDSGDFAIVALLVNAGVDVNTRDITGGSPLSIAAARGYYEIVQLLLSNGADVNARSTGPFGGSSALDMAEMGGHKNVMNLLRAYGAKE